MSELVEFRIQGGAAVVVEMEEEQAGLVPAGRRAGEIAREAAQTFEEAIASILPAAEIVTRELRKLTPDELGVELGIKLTAEAGAVIAKAGGEANFKVTLKWSDLRKGQAAAEQDINGTEPAERPAPTA
jgi:hypothetical protein